MSSDYKIQYLTRQEVDIERWNDCIDNAENGLIYSYTYYLDALCRDWDAIVVGDYDAVMPLPWKKKAGIKYLYAPPFIQQLGLTGNVEANIYKELFETIKKRFKYGDVFFNYGNTQLPMPNLEKTNFILTLNKTYPEMFLLFSNVLKKNLKTPKEDEWFYSKSCSHQQVIIFYKEKYGNRMPHVTNADYENFYKLCTFLNEKEMLLTRAIVDKEQKILATVLLLRCANRLYNIMNTTSLEGRKANANHYLLTEVLREFSTSNLIFDFEGSDLPGVKEFYQGFGAINQPYFHYHFNFLSFPLRLLKK